MDSVQLQRQFAAYIRDPDRAPAPAGVEPRRLQIYRDLFFNNIEGFVSSAFPVLRSITDDCRWQALVRAFLQQHRCHTPYFLEISQEFLSFLQQGNALTAGDPAFTLELAHYEWVELALDVADDDLDALAVDPAGDLLAARPLLSPLAWSLSYRFPVHRIGPAYVPAQAPAEPTYLVVYRDLHDKVGFMEINAVTARLLDLLREPAAASGLQVLEQLAAELQRPGDAALIAHGHALLQQLRERDIVLGTIMPGTGDS